MSIGHSAGLGLTGLHQGGLEARDRVVQAIEFRQCPAHVVVRHSVSRREPLDLLKALDGGGMFPVAGERVAEVVERACNIRASRKSAPQCRFCLVV